MSLALSFLGGMAKRGMQLNDERRAIDQQILIDLVPEEENEVLGTRGRLPPPCNCRSPS